MKIGIKKESNRVLGWILASHKMGLLAGGAVSLSDSCELEWKGSASASRLDLEGGAGNFLSCSKVA